VWRCVIYPERAASLARPWPDTAKRKTNSRRWAGDAVLISTQPRWQWRDRIDGTWVAGLLQIRATMRFIRDDFARLRYEGAPATFSAKLLAGLSKPACETMPTTSPSKTASVSSSTPRSHAALPPSIYTNHTRVELDFPWQPEPGSFMCCARCAETAAEASAFCVELAGSSDRR